MQSNNLTDIELTKSLGCVRGLHTQEMSGLGESINNNHTSVTRPLAQVPGNEEENQRMVVLLEFLRQNPPTFQGSSNPLEVDRGIRRVKKVFDGMRVAEDLNVGLAIYLFDGEANHWWESVKRMRDTNALTDSFWPSRCSESTKFIA